MKNILFSNGRILTAFLLLSLISIITSCRRERYVCECYSKIKGATTNELGEVKQNKAEERCNFIYVHLKAVDTSIYCQLTTPYERN